MSACVVFVLVALVASALTKAEAVRGEAAGRGQAQSPFSRLQAGPVPFPRPSRNGADYRADGRRPVYPPGAKSPAVANFSIYNGEKGTGMCMKF